MPSIPTPIRVGVVGLSTSGWASMALIPSMLNLPKAPYKIMGICTLNPKTPQQVEELRQKFGNDLQIYRSPEEMAAARDIDRPSIPVSSTRRIFLSNGQLPAF